MAGRATTRKRPVVGGAGWRPVLAKRPRGGHKGTFGTVLVVGGSCVGTTRMIGAPALAALGALRAGCGLCRVAAPEPIIGHVLRVAPSATGVALPCGAGGQVDGAAAGRVLRRAVLGADVVIVGPGLGEGAGAERVVRAVLRAARVLGKPVVVDADALNAIARGRVFGGAGRKAGPGPGMVFTPHPGEWRRLAAACGVRGDPVTPRLRGAAAKALAQRLGVLVVLKGAGTVVSDGECVWRNRTGNVALATGGTGDVLAGVIAGLIAQAGGVPGALLAATCAGVRAHGRAADLWARAKRASGGLMATDLLEWLPRAVEEMRKG